MYELRTNGERRIFGFINEETHNEQDALGRERYSWTSQETNIPFEPGDILILAAGDAATLSIGVFDEIATHQEDCKEIINREIPHSSWGVTILKK